MEERKERERDRSRKKEIKMSTTGLQVLHKLFKNTQQLAYDYFFNFPGKHWENQHGF